MMGTGEDSSQCGGHPASCEIEESSIDSTTLRKEKERSTPLPLGFRRRTTRGLNPLNRTALHYSPYIPRQQETLNSVHEQHELATCAPEHAGSNEKKGAVVWYGRSNQS